MSVEYIEEKRVNKSREGEREKCKKNRNSKEEKK